MYDDLDRPPLGESELRTALTSAGSRWTQVDVVQESPSTNASLVERAASDGGDGLVLVAEHQTAGRGRLDRTWTTPPRAAITMSALVRPAGVPLSRWPWISLLSGLAVAAAVRQVADVGAMLKWPNDVVVDDRKLAGLLVERVEGAFGPAAVIGVGLNVSTTRAELPTPYATSLALEGATTTDRPTLVKAILRRLDGLLAQWEGGAGRPSIELQNAYRAACATVGQQVRLEVHGRETVDGVAVGIDESGRLLVHTESGEVAFAAGDVVHVRRPA